MTMASGGSDVLLERMTRLHPKIIDLTLARVERERESLDEVEVNLRKVLATALEIDRERARLAQERQKWAEERELRSRMAGSYGSAVGRAESERLFAAAYAEHARRLARALAGPALVDLEQEGVME